MDTAVSEKHLQVEDVMETFPLTRDTEGPCTTEYVSADWSAEGKQENLTAVKQEPDDVRCLWYFVLHSFYHNRVNFIRSLTVAEVFVTI